MGMVRVMCGAAALVSVVAWSTPRVADAAAQPGETPLVGRSLVQRVPRPDPFDRLFLLPGQQPTPAPRAPRPSRETLVEDTGPALQRQPVIKCGTTLVPADPSIDPKIYAPRGPRDPRYAIRGVTPEICK